MQLDQLQVNAILGMGAFAKVALITHKPSGEVFALKKMDRQHLMSENVTHQVMNERFALGDFDHPCIAKLVTTFKTAKSLFMLLEPCSGGELFTHMKQERRLDEPSSCFYASCVALALGHMHSRSLIYRDVKPENILLKANGYSTVVDFGFAKRVYTRTYTLCGTPEYLAPELILCKGHGKSVDWWAVSNLLYEMLMGAAPFVFENGMPDFSLPPTTLYQNILNPQYKFHLPPEMPGGAVDLCMRLFAFEPMYRLGTLTGGAEDVRKHPFFVNAGFDWDALLAGKVTPPFLPKVSSATDVSNFEEMSQEDPSFLMGSPVVSKPTDWDYDF